MALETLYRFRKDVVIRPVIIPELELRDVQREILGADLMESPDHSALNQAPKALNRIGMNGTDNILASGMVNGDMREILGEMLIAHPFIGAEQANLGRNAFMNEPFKGSGADVLDHAGDDFALAANSASDDGFTSATSPAAAVPALVFMPVLGFATDESLVSLDNADKLLEIFLGQSGPDAVAHMPSRPVRAEAHHAMDLEGGNTLLAGQHEVDHAEPLAKRLIRVLKHGADKYRKAVGRAVSTVHALPFPRLRGHLVNALRAAARALDALRPPMGDQIGAASVLVRERRFPLGNGHLMDLLLFHSRWPRHV